MRRFAAAIQVRLPDPHLIAWSRNRKLMGGLVALYGAASAREKRKALFKHGTCEPSKPRAWTAPEFRRVYPQLIGMQAMGDLG